VATGERARSRFLPPPRRTSRTVPPNGSYASPTPEPVEQPAEGHIDGAVVMAVDAIKQAAGDKRVGVSVGDFDRDATKTASPTVAQTAHADRARASTEPPHPR
jgi:hypothetical protein